MSKIYFFVTQKLIQIGASVLLICSLTACGQTGDLYLTKETIAKNKTQDQPQAPSVALKPMSVNQRVLNDV